MFILNCFLHLLCSFWKLMISLIVNFCTTLPSSALNLHRNCAHILTKWIRSCFIREDIIYVFILGFTNFKIIFIKIIDIAITLSLLDYWSKILPCRWTISSKNLILITEKKTEIIFCWFTLWPKCFWITSTDWWIVDFFISNHFWMNSF